MSYILTYTGVHFDPVAPDENLIDERDISHSLALLCRANGHFTHFYSVGEHSIACAKEAIERRYSREVILGCLLHDASEAYLSDVTRPIKKDLPYYLEVEDKLQNLLWEHFIGRPLTKEEKDLIFMIDDIMLSREFLLLMKEKIDDRYLELKTNVTCEFREFEKCEEEFLEILNKYI